RRAFKPDPDFYTAHLRLLICLANVSSRAPDQTELGSTGIADLAVDRARAFNRDGDCAPPGTNLWQPIFRRTHTLSRARDRSSARAKFNREIIFVQARVAPTSCLRLTAARSLGAKPRQSASPERMTSWTSPARDPETRSGLPALAGFFVHAQLFRRRS